MKPKRKHLKNLILVILMVLFLAVTMSACSLMDDLQELLHSELLSSLPSTTQPHATISTRPVTEPDVTVPQSSSAHTRPTEPTVVPTEPTVIPTEPVTVPTIPTTVPTEPIPCEHTYVAEVVNATCVEPGYTNYVCALCGDSYADDYTELGDHSYTDWQTKVEATCKQEGEEISTCVYCADVQTRIVSMIDHDYNEWTVSKEATCTSEGLEVCTCAYCGVEKKRSLEALGHSYDTWQVTQDATCTDSGLKERTCKRCGDHQSKKVDATGHDYDNGVITKEAASCTDTGIKCYTCKNCNHQFEQVVMGEHSMSCVTCEEYTEGSYDALHAPGYKTDWMHHLGCQYCDFGYADRTYNLLCQGLITEDSALYTDTIKLKNLKYTGVMSTWSERWHEFDTFTKMGIMYGSWSRKDGWEGQNYEYRVWDVTSYAEAEAILADYNAFAVEFAKVYYWKPVEVKMEYIEDKQYVKLYYYDQDQYDTYRKQKKNVSDEQKQALANEMIGYTLQKWGIRDGMNTANTLELVYYMIWTDVAYYDQSLRFHSAYDGFATHTCVCDGFSEIFQLYADALGIQSKEVFGTLDGVGHAWNRVTFSDGTKWHVDITNGPILITDEKLREYGYKW